MKSRLWLVIVLIGLVGLAVTIVLNATQPEATLGLTSASPTKLASVTPTLSPTTPTPVPSTTSTIPATFTLEPLSAPVVHVVQPGEIPLSIAARYSVTVEALLTINNITDPTTLQIGQELLIPLAPISLTAGQIVSHQVKLGDTLLMLAGRYGSTVDDILALNPGLEPTKLQVGQSITIPLTRPPQPLTNSTPNLPNNLASPPPNLVTLAQEMIDAVNIQRHNNNLPSLIPNEKLTTVASAHAQDLVTRGYFDHVTPEGRTLRDRLQQHGLTLNWVGENIQRNTEVRSQAVQTAVDWFMHSPPHRQNILHAHFTHLGVGVVESPPGWFTFVLVFAEM